MKQGARGVIYTGSMLGLRILGPIGSGWQVEGGAVQSAGTGCGGGMYIVAIRVE